MPYLDVLLTKEVNKLETTVPTSTMIIPKSSGTLHQYKLSALGTYTNRTIRFCSTRNLLENELRKIK